MSIQQTERELEIGRPWRMKRTAPMYQICVDLLRVAAYTATNGNKTLCGLVNTADSQHPSLAAIAVELDDGSIRFFNMSGLHIPAPDARGFELTLGEAQWHAG